eukprot:gene2766-1751_t
MHHPQAKQNSRQIEVLLQNRPQVYLYQSTPALNPKPAKLTPNLSAQPHIATVYSATTTSKYIEKQVNSRRRTAQVPKALRALLIPGNKASLNNNPSTSSCYQRSNK